MKLIYLFLFISSIVGYAHEERNIPNWVRNHLNDDSVITSKLNGKPISFSLKLFDNEEVKEQIAGNKIKQRMIPISSTLIKTKRVAVVDSFSGHQWDYSVGLFKCEYPNTKITFNVWVILKAIEAGVDADKVSKSIVNSDEWKGLRFRKIRDSNILTIAGTLVDNPIEKDGKKVYFSGLSCIYLDSNKKVIVDSLPYRSYIQPKGANGYMGYWYPFSSWYLVSDMQTTISTDYGDRVTDLRIFFYDVRNRKMSALALTLNVEEIAKQLPLKLKSGRKINHYAEVLENPFSVVSLQDGKRALRLYLPSDKHRKAEEYLLIPEF